MCQSPANLASALGRVALRRLCLAIPIMMVAFPVLATPLPTQVDLQGPPGSSSFGGRVAVLPNGNFVVVDSSGPSAGIGAVHLYSAHGELISTLTGSNPMDMVGVSGIEVLASGDFLVRSPMWDNPETGAENAGAVTLVDGELGLSGVVSAANSLVGSSSADFVGSSVQALPDGAYVVLAAGWDKGDVEDVGAVVLVPAGSNSVGPISGFNALVGSKANDWVGDGEATVLANGNVVVCSSTWDNGALEDVGAATWIDASQGIAGAVTVANSLIGASAHDRVGYSCATPLANGNYVVKSRYWHNDGVRVGAATWAHGSTGLTGEVSMTNSLVGVQLDDSIGENVYALANGHYVVVSRFWDLGAVEDVGVAAWCDGEVGASGPVSAATSLVGSGASDQVGSAGIIALANGNYVVLSPSWSSGVVDNVGAATWRDGSGPHPGVVSAGNSLVGILDLGQVGAWGTALANGNYVVGSPFWHGDDSFDGQAHGAATWGDGASGTSGVVSSANSLVGTVRGDGVGQQVVALDDGNYVVVSPGWDNSTTVDVGAVTWGDGASGTAGEVGVANSLVGAGVGDMVGLGGVVAVSGGGYAVSSPRWNGPGEQLGAVTGVMDSSGRIGAVGLANSLVGSSAADHLGSRPPLLLPDGNLVLRSLEWDNGPLEDAGAVTLVPGDGSMVGPIGPHNSVVGGIAGIGLHMSDDLAYDPERRRLVVGRGAENLVTLLSLPSITVFASGFE